MRVSKWIVAIVLLAAVRPAAAQDEERKTKLIFGGGTVLTTGTIGEHQGSGYNFTVGVRFRITPIIGLQVEYGYHDLTRKDKTYPVAGTPGGTTTSAVFGSDMNTQFGAISLVVEPSKSESVAPYFIGGVGYYNQMVNIRTSAVGYTNGFCEAWWFTCYPAAWVPTSQIAGDRSAASIGVNVGGGVSFKAGGSARVYVEARYHYVPGPSITDSSTNATQKASGTFFPITVGLRF